ncbi:glucose 1-dehydrogenase [Acuticoccus kandeliae]|uniref:glucose 1-dehydrogenase n=1 Tax=Acuticoccus kandeliae TaxID=2073160 RepID=UPI000D3E412D|nr:glucose 1-dehydrogenase [Acuticoccus kandeliae]
MSEASERPRTAVVTGAATGIGRAIAFQLHHDGYAVAINDIGREGAEKVAAEIVAAGGRACAVPGDVSDPAFADQMIADAVEALGPLAVLVANAGINIIKPFLEFEEKDLERIFRINVFGVFYCVQAAARVMIAQGQGGKIINAASAGGKRGYELLGAYSATKFATVSITQTAALEFAKHGITVNSYCPGAIDTGMWEMIDETIGGINNVARGETLKARVAKIPLGRVGYPSDVARLVSFLASEKADYMTGQSLVVDGGVILS